MLTRRRFLKVGGGALAGACLVGLASCGGQGGSLLAVDRIGRADAPKSFSLQLNADYSHQAPTQSWAQGFERLFTNWAKEHPDWRIDLTIVPSEQTTQASARLVEEARAERAPDCANINFTEIPLFVQQGILQPIDEYFSESDIEGFFPFVRETIIGSDGRLYAYWFNTDLRALYRRKDLVSEAPKTWDELVQAALEAKEQDQSVTDGYLFNGGRWVGTSFDNLAHYWSQGGELTDSSGRPIFGEGENRARMLDVLNFLKRTIDSGASPQRVTTITDYSEFNTAAQSGTVAMFLGGHWQYGELEEILPPEEYEKWEVSPIPAEQSGQQATSNGGWTFAALTEDSEKISVFADFVRSVYEGPAHEVTGQLPTSAKLFDELESFQTPVYDTFKSMLEFGHTLPASPINNTFLNELQVTISGTLTGESTAEAAIDAAAKNLIRAYDRAQK